MKKIISIVIASAFVMFSAVAFANPNDKADEYSDPNVKVVVTYTAPDAKAEPAKVERDTPADLVTAQRHLNKMRAIDGHKELNVSNR